LDYIVMQMRKINCEKGYWWVTFGEVGILKKSIALCLS